MNKHGELVKSCVPALQYQLTRDHIVNTINYTHRDNKSFQFFTRNRILLVLLIISVYIGTIYRVIHTTYVPLDRTNGDVVSTSYDALSSLDFLVILVLHTGFFSIGWLFFIYKLNHDVDRMFSVIVIFSTTFSYAISLLFLLLVEVMNMMRYHLRWVYWKINLTMLLFILVVLVPVGLIREIVPSQWNWFFRAFASITLYITVWYLLLFGPAFITTTPSTDSVSSTVRPPSSSSPHIVDPSLNDIPLRFDKSNDTNQSFFWLPFLSIQTIISRLGIIGVSSIALLSGYGAINFPNQNWRVLMKNVQASDLVLFESGWSESIDQICDTKSKLLLRSLHLYQYRKKVYIKLYLDIITAQTRHAIRSTMALSPLPPPTQVMTPGGMSLIAERQRLLDRVSVDRSFLPASTATTQPHVYDNRYSMGHTPVDYNDPLARSLFGTGNTHSRSSFEGTDKENGHHHSSDMTNGQAIRRHRGQSIASPEQHHNNSHSRRGTERPISPSSTSTLSMLLSTLQGHNDTSGDAIGIGIHNDDDDAYNAALYDDPEVGCHRSRLPNQQQQQRQQHQYNNRPSTERPSRTLMDTLLFSTTDLVEGVTDLVNTMGKALDNPDSTLSHDPDDDNNNTNNQHGGDYNPSGTLSTSQQLLTGLSLIRPSRTYDDDNYYNIDGNYNDKHLILKELKHYDDVNTLSQVPLESSLSSSSSVLAGMGGAGGPRNHNSIDRYDNDTGFIQAQIEAQQQYAAAVVAATTSTPGPTTVLPDGRYPINSTSPPSTNTTTGQQHRHHHHHRGPSIDNPANMLSPVYHQHRPPTLQSAARQQTASPQPNHRDNTPEPFNQQKQQQHLKTQHRHSATSQQTQPSITPAHFPTSLMAPYASLTSAHLSSFLAHHPNSVHILPARILGNRSQISTIKPSLHSQFIVFTPPSLPPTTLSNQKNNDPNSLLSPTTQSSRPSSLLSPSPLALTSSTIPGTPSRPPTSSSSINRPPSSSSGFSIRPLSSSFSLSESMNDPYQQYTYPGRKSSQLYSSPHHYNTNRPHSYSREHDFEDRIPPLPRMPSVSSSSSSSSFLTSPILYIKTCILSLYASPLSKIHKCIRSSSRFISLLLFGCWQRTRSDQQRVSILAQIDYQMAPLPSSLQGKVQIPSPSLSQSSQPRDNSTMDTTKTTRTHQSKPDASYRENNTNSIQLNITQTALSAIQNSISSLYISLQAFGSMQQVWAGDILQLRSSQAQLDRALNSFKGKFQHLWSYIMMSFCLFQFILCSKNLIFGRHGEQRDPISRVVSFILHDVLHIPFNIEYWSSYLSFILLSALVITQVRGFLINATKIFRLGSSMITPMVILLLFIFMMGVYFISMILLLRMHLPPHFRPVLSLVLGDLQWQSFHRLFEFIFVISALTTFCIFVVERRTRANNDTIMLHHHNNNALPIASQSSLHSKNSIHHHTNTTNNYYRSNNNNNSTTSSSMYSPSSSYDYRYNHTNNYNNQNNSNSP